jgi:hypothetical protein
MSGKEVFTDGHQIKKKFRDTFVSLAAKAFQSRLMLLIIDNERDGLIKPVLQLYVVAFRSGD